MVMEKSGKRIFDIASLYNSAILAKDALLNNENLKQRICEDLRVKHIDRPEKVLFTLQQNDIVYLPENIDDPVLKLNKEEFKTWLNEVDNKKKLSKRVYKVVKFTGKDCFFIPHNYANVISVSKDLTKDQKDELQKQLGDKKIPKKDLNFVEFGSYRDCSPYEAGDLFIRSLTADKADRKWLPKPLKIQDSCIKVQIDWLGNVVKATT
jgi:hypothetical protein